MPVYPKKHKYKNNFPPWRLGKNAVLRALQEDEDIRARGLAEAEQRKKAEEGLGLPADQVTT